MAQQPSVGQSCPILEVSRSHTVTHATVGRASLGEGAERGICKNWCSGNHAVLWLPHQWKKYVDFNGDYVAQRPEQLCCDTIYIDSPCP
jgi:hypothetical protein